MRRVLLTQRLRPLRIPPKTALPKATFRSSPERFEILSVRRRDIDRTCKARMPKKRRDAPRPPHRARPIPKVPKPSGPMKGLPEEHRRHTIIPHPLGTAKVRREEAPIIAQPLHLHILAGTQKEHPRTGVLIPDQRRKRKRLVGLSHPHFVSEVGKGTLTQNIIERRHPFALQRGHRTGLRGARHPKVDEFIHIFRPNQMLKRPHGAPPSSSESRSSNHPSIASAAPRSAPSSSISRPRVRVRASEASASTRPTNSASSNAAHARITE